MEALIWIIVGLFVLYLAFEYWPITLALGVIWLIIHLVRKEMKAEKERKAERERQRLEEERRQREHNQQQAQYRESLVGFGDNSLSLFEEMPRHLMTTEELLDQAELDFQERAFAPFWDSVESAATHLGRYDENVRKITDNAQRHCEIAQRYEGNPPPFPITESSVNGVQAAKPSNERLRYIVRAAQRDFEFATIYEQRKTNQLLVAGFTNLAQALEGMGQRIASSIDDLSSQITYMTTSIDNLAEGVSEALATVNSSVQDFSEQSLQRQDEALQRHDRALEMLDNIQRRRRPRPTGFRDGEY